MAYYKRKSNRSYSMKDKNYDPSEVYIPKSEPAGAPEQTQRIVDQTFANKTFSGLGLETAFTPKANPYTQAAEASYPYPLVARPNRIIENNYGEKSNLIGNILPQLLNNTQSKMLNYYDSALIRLSINYRHLAYNPDKTNAHNCKRRAYNVEMQKAFDEALSKGYAETFTQLPVFLWNWSYSGNAEWTGISGPLAGLLSYQIFLQKIAGVVQAYNKALAMESHLKRMAFNRESPLLDNIYGLLKKSSFRNMMKTVASLISGEYFDTDWMKVVSPFTQVPSRFSSAIYAPLLDVTTHYTMPRVIATVGEDPVTVFDSNAWTLGSTAIDDLVLKLTPHYLLQWARLTMQGVNTGLTAIGYFNQLETHLNSILSTAAVFKSQVVDLRTLIDVFQRVGMTRWQKGLTLTVADGAQYDPVYNKTLNDIYASYLAGSGSFIYNSTTRRWGFYSLWDASYGIPEYDKKFGGLQLLTAVKAIPNDGSGGTAYLNNKYLLPQLFEPISFYRYQVFPNLAAFGSPAAIVAQNRYGYDVGIYSPAEGSISSNAVLARLDALGTGILSRIPTAAGQEYKIGTTSFTSAEHSAMLNFVESVFDLGRVRTGTSTYEYSINDDMIAFIDVEIDDSSNEMVTYAKTTGPLVTFRG